MENLDLTYKLVDLKIKSKAPDQICFMSKKKIKVRIIHLYLLLSPPSQDGELFATLHSRLFSR